MGADKNARPANQQCQKSEQKRATGQVVKCERRDNGDRCRGVIGGKRPISALGNDQVADVGAIRSDPMDEQEDDLIEAKPDQKGEPGGDAGMAHVLPIDLAPPTGDD